MQNGRQINITILMLLAAEQEQPILTKSHMTKHSHSFHQATQNLDSQKQDTRLLVGLTAMARLGALTGWVNLGLGQVIIMQKI